MKYKNKCLNCQKRTVGCHSVCGDYKEFKDKLNAISIETKAERDIRAYQYERNCRARKRMAHLIESIGFKKTFGYN